MSLVNSGFDDVFLVALSNRAGMTLREWMDANCTPGVYYLTRAVAEYLQIPYPLQKGWVEKYGALVLSQEQASDLRQICSVQDRARRNALAQALLKKSRWEPQPLQRAKRKPDLEFIEYLHLHCPPGKYVINAAIAKYMGIPYPLRAGWVAEYASVVLTAEQQRDLDMLRTEKSPSVRNAMADRLIAQRI